MGRFIKTDAIRFDNVHISPIFKELILHIAKSFHAGDVRGTGEVHSADFSNMMEKASVVPTAVGFVPRMHGDMTNKSRIAQV